MLELKELSKRYGSTQALREVSLTLGPGEIVGLFGENGAGKTTLMKCVLGLLHHQGPGDAGRRGRHPAEHCPALLRHLRTLLLPGPHPGRSPGLLPQPVPSLPGKALRGSDGIFRAAHGPARRRYSAGQKNQFEVILALSQGADYILMDEPFAGNDVFNRDDFYKVLLGILEPQETVLLSTHLIEEVSQFVSRACCCGAERSSATRRSRTWRRPART